MPTGVTKIENLIDPEVMADIISGKIDSRVVVTPFAKIDKTLEGQPGDTITVPAYAYIGDAEDVAEGDSATAVKLTATTTQTKVKKAMKAVTLTDEAVLSGYGNPVGETNTQIAKAIASKIDMDAMDALMGAQLVHNGASAKISYTGIVDALDKFDEEIESDKVMFIHPQQRSAIRKDSNFLAADKIAEKLIVAGAIGKVANTEIVVSKKARLVQYEKDENGSITITAQNMKDYKDKVLGNLAVGDKLSALSVNYFANPIVKLNADTDTEDETPAITIYRKRNVNVEKERHTLSRTTDISGDVHYAAALTDASKVVLAKFKE